MRTYLETNFETARADYLGHVTWMHQSNLSNAEKNGGVDRLRENPDTAEAKRFLGIERRLISLAAFDDAATEYLKELSRIVELQAETINKLNADLRQYKRAEKPPLEALEIVPFRSYLQLMLLASPIPKKLGALLDYKEGRRQASRTYAATTQPHLF